MTDRLDIERDGVTSAGSMMSTEADEATLVLPPLFDSAHPGAAGNAGFATGAKVIAFAELLRRQVESAITELATTGNSIVTSAQMVQIMEGRGRRRPQPYAHRAQRTRAGRRARTYLGPAARRIYPQLGFHPQFPVWAR
ncbi:MAG: hypothetical protein ACSLE6_13135 [Mycobacterium sp.]